MLKILFLAANPLDTNQLQLREEARAIDEALREAEYREQFELETQWAVRVEDLENLRLRYLPHIVHFSGHGSEESAISKSDLRSADLWAANLRGADLTRALSSTYGLAQRL